MSVFAGVFLSKRPGYLAAVLGIAAVTVVCAAFRAHLNGMTVSLAMLLVVLLVAAGWGSGPAYLAAVAGVVSFAYFFVPPAFVLTASSSRDWVALFAFLATAFIAGQLSQRARRRELAFRDSEANLKAAQKIAQVGSWHLDIARNRLTCSEEACRIWGIPKSAEATYEMFLDRVDPEDRESVRQAWSGAMHGAPFDVEHRLSVDGKLKWVREIARFRFDSRGQAVEANGTVQDITETRQAVNEIRRLARFQEVVAQLGEHALRHPSLSDVVDDATAHVALTLNVEYCKVLELLPNRQALLLRSGVGWKEGRVGRATVEIDKGSQAGYTLLVDQPVVVEDFATEKRFASVPLLEEHGVVSGMSVVISTKQGPYGILGAHTSRRRAFAANEVHFLQSVANVLGSAIERQRSEQELWRIHRAQRALSKCNEALVRTASESRLLQQVCDIVVEEAGYRFSWVGRAESDEAKSVRAVAKAGFEVGYLDTLNVTWADTESGRGPCGTCIRTGRTVVVRNIATDPQMLPWREESLKRGYASCVAIPLRIDSAVFGALSIYASEPETFGAEEVKLLSELASDLAFGMGALRTRAAHAAAEEKIRALNAELEQRVARRTAELQEANRELEQAREREIEVGFKIQQVLLLDRPPKDMPGLRVAALTVPSQRIDGDFYVFIKHQDESLDVIVGDVMGKGTPAALLGAATKSQFLQAINNLLDISKGREVPEPEEIVMLAHAGIVRDLISLESFVTLSYVRVDASRHSLELVDCGHTGLLHVHGRTGRCEIVRGDNLPMGVRESEIYDQVSAPLESDDLLLLFSDGITDARDPSGEAFGVARLQQCVVRHRRREPEALVEALRREVFAFSGSDRPTDDLTAVAIRLRPMQLPTARAESEIQSDLVQLGRARQFVRDFCRDLPGRPLDEQNVAWLELAVHEATSNIMRHAYHGRPGHAIQIEGMAFSDRVLIRLHHYGDAFNPSKKPIPKLDLSGKSGFGLHLIAKIADGVRYYQDDRGRNCVELVKTYKS